MHRLRQAFVLILGFAGSGAPGGVISAEDETKIEIVDYIQDTTLQVSPSDLSEHIFSGDRVSILKRDGTTLEATIENVSKSESGQYVLIVQSVNSKLNWSIFQSEIFRITIFGDELRQETVASVSNEDTEADTSPKKRRPITFTYPGKDADDCSERAWDVGRTRTGEGLLNFSSLTSGMTTSTTCLTGSSTNASVASSASSASDDMAFNRYQQRQLVAPSRDRLAIDFANGGGEYASALAHLHGCPADSHQRYASLVRRNFTQIFPATADDPEQILKRLGAQVLQDPELASACIRIS